MPAKKKAAGKKPAKKSPAKKAAPKKAAKKATPAKKAAPKKPIPRSAAPQRSIEPIPMRTLEPIEEHEEHLEEHHEDTTGMIECEHCLGAGKCTAGEPYDKGHHQVFGAKLILTSCFDCLEASGEHRNSKKLVGCRVCEGRGLVKA